MSIPARPLKDPGGFEDSTAYCPDEDRRSAEVLVSALRTVNADHSESAHAELRAAMNNRQRVLHSYVFSRGLCGLTNHESAADARDSGTARYLP
jgi:hypothetical protein